MISEGVVARLPQIHRDAYAGLWKNDSERMGPPFAKLADPMTKDYPVVVTRALVERVQKCGFSHQTDGGWLAVDQRCQTQRIGAALLRDAV